MNKSLAAVLFVMLSITGCGSARLVDANVRSYASAPYVPVGASYRFERLPSQQTQAARQSALEAVAQQALAKVGLQRNDAAASYTVQVSATLKIDPYSPWHQPWPGYGLGWGLGWGVGHGQVMIGGHRAFTPGFGLSDMPYYWRQVSLVMRKVSSAQVVYETHAAHDGPWSDSEEVLPAMFDAALQDFPMPTQGVRRINIEIPR